MGKKQNENQIVGNEDIIRTDAERKAKGKALYGYDYATKAKQEFGDKLLHIKFKTSQHAHAKIKKIDKKEAEQIKGVKKIYTHENVPDIKFTTAGQAYPEPSPYDTKVLNEVVRFAGEPVAIIAAENPKIAKKAKQKIKVEYEKKRKILNPKKALKNNTKIHKEGNLIDSLEVEVGDVEEAFERSDTIIEDSFKTNIQKHVHMEPLACVSHINDKGTLIVETSNQVVYHIRRIIGKILDRSMNEVRVRSWEIGGGFGDKQDMNIEHYSAFVTHDTGRPSVTTFDRKETFVESKNRHSIELEIKIASNNDGTINGIKLSALSDTGAYGAHGPTVAVNIGAHSLPLYTDNCKNLKFNADIVYTNKPPAGAFRGYGAPQGGYALEQAMDELAEELGMDPIDLRVKNALREGNSDPMSKVLSEAGEVEAREIKSCKLVETLDDGKKKFNWDERRSNSGKTDSEGRKYGVGVASGMTGSGVAGFELGSSFIKLNEDGTVLVTIGASDLGQGAESAMSQIAAETIGLNLEDVEIVSADTGRTTFDMGSYASSVTYVTGNAVEKASRDLRGKIIERASEMMDRRPEDLRIGDGEVFVKENPNVGLEIEEIGMEVVYSENDRDQLIGFGKAESVLSPPPFGTHFVELWVDEDTGEIEFGDYLTMNDVGTAINPKEVEGQIEGATVQAMGYAMSEEMVFNEEGQLRNPNLTDYKVLTSLDVPDFETEIVESSEPTGPYGAKSAAEVGIVPPAPAIANAIYNATGVRVKEIPMTKERLATKFNF